MSNRLVLRIAFFLLLASCAQAAEPKDFAGTWAMPLGERNFFVLTLVADGEGVHGTLDRPTHFSGTNLMFTNIRGGVRSDAIVRSHFADGVLHFTTQNASDKTDEDRYAMVLKANRAELSIDGLPQGLILQPLLLDRAPTTAKVATDWNPDRLYMPGDSDTPNAEMKVIFDEDQRVRSARRIDWQAVGRTDAYRREQTRKLLAEGALRTGKDYEEASFIFQHGDSSQDYLLAHTLAMVAVSKGDTTAIWISAATLDRYLEKIGQKQVFGTQYSRDPKGVWTQDPYDRALVSDALRQQLGVPPQAIQAEQLKTYQTQH